MLGEDIFSNRSRICQLFCGVWYTAFLNSRRKFVSQIGLGLAIPFMFNLRDYNRHNYKVIKQRIFFPDLPDAWRIQDYANRMCTVVVW
jgi:hypothetical protein